MTMNKLLYKRLYETRNLVGINCSHVFFTCGEAGLVYESLTVQG